MPEYEEMQDDLSEDIKSMLRTKLGRKYYNGKVQAVVILTNSVTGKVSIDSCNVPLIADTKKMLSEAYEQLQRFQLVSAIKSVYKPIRRKKK